MAADSFEFKIISGGFNHCDTSWNESNDELNRCFKIYNPINGDAIINVDNTEYLIESGNIYFISGFKIVSQKCTSFMDIYWLHFIPTSLYLRQILLHSEPVHIWNGVDFLFMDDFNNCIQQLFGKDKPISSNITILPYSFEEAKVHSYILNFVADILKKTPAFDDSTSRELKMLEPSVNFMNSEFRKNPALEEIASKSALATNYFHRIFKKNFGITPLRYMIRLRMELAVRLLTTTEKGVKEVAFETGYENEFYFYRQFKKQYGYSPGKLKKIRPF